MKTQVKYAGDGAGTLTLNLDVGWFDAFTQTFGDGLRQVSPNAHRNTAGFMLWNNGDVISPDGRLLATLRHR